MAFEGPQSVAASAADPEQALEKLHGSFSSGNLRVLVGAGVSVGSGFPTWELLTKRLLGESVAELTRSVVGNHPARSLVDDPVNRQVDALFDRLGRDAVPDLVLDLHGPRCLHAWLAKALYRDLSASELPVRSVHKQLAAMALATTSERLLHTTNYDPLLELALEYVLAKRGESVEWRTLVDPAPTTYPPRTAGPFVTHLHGFIDEVGNVSKQIVITESHYLELQKRKKAHANQVLRELLDGDETLLIVGMSLDDPNLRRLLHERGSRLNQTSGKQVFALMRGSESDLQDWYLLEFWERKLIEPLFFQEYGDLPFILRQIQIGLDRIDRVKIAEDWLRAKIAGAGSFDFFGEDWRKDAHERLGRFRRQVERYFAIPSEERLDLRIYTPIGPGTDPPGDYIYELASSRRWRDESRTKADKAKVRLDSTAAGVACVVGIAFSRGETFQRTDSGEGFPRWRSVLAVPVLDTPQWVPVATLALTSNKVEAFWERLEAPEISFLKDMLRNAFSLLVDSLSAAGKNAT